jgi:hypothetical protein
MHTTFWKMALFAVGIVAVAALLVIAGAKATELGMFGRHHQDYHTAAFRLASATHRLR